MVLSTKLFILGTAQLAAPVWRVAGSGTGAAWTIADHGGRHERRHRRRPRPIRRIQRQIAQRPRPVLPRKSKPSEYPGLLGLRGLLTYVFGNALWPTFLISWPRSSFKVYRFCWLPSRLVEKAARMRWSFSQFLTQVFCSQLLLFFLFPVAWQDEAAVFLSSESAPSLMARKSCIC